MILILVYNEGKNSSEDYDNKNSSKDCKIKNQDSSKARIGKYFYSKAKKKYIRFGLERFEKLYFQEVFTYTEQEFEDSFLDFSYMDSCNLLYCLLYTPIAIRLNKVLIML